MKMKTVSRTTISGTVFGLIFFILIAAVSYFSLDNNDFVSFAQDNTKVNATEPSNVPNDNKDNNNKTNGKYTFTLGGTIDSLVYVPSNNSTSTTSNLTEQLDTMDKFILSGNWNISAKNGEITGFKTNFIKVMADGNRWHTHDLIDFQQDNNTKVKLTSDNSLSMKGLVDVKLNNTIPWNNTNVDVSISKGNTINIKLNNEQTSNHFQGQSIYGIVTK
jgi:hypothetical protein